MRIHIIVKIFHHFFLLLFVMVATAYSQDEPSRVMEPRITRKFLPYEKWEKEYMDYNRRHYRDPSLVLKPGAIVMHYTTSRTFSSAWDTFCQGAMYDDGDVGTVFGHLSVHFIIDRDGTIYQTLPLDRRCRGAYGVNHVALSIEMVSPDEGDLLKNKKLQESSFRLVTSLMKRFSIPLEKVYGHYQVSAGKKYVPEYLDYGDSRYPGSYPPAFGRTDPGRTYMDRLRTYLKSASARDAGK
jgi:N-acetylmuramoyl-L-alanine amidase